MAHVLSKPLRIIWIRDKEPWFTVMDRQTLEYMLYLSAQNYKDKMTRWRS